MTEKDLIEGLNLDYLSTNPWAIMMISALKGQNIEAVVNWLITKSKEKKK